MDDIIQDKKRGNFSLSKATKIILIVVVVLFMLGILGVGGYYYFSVVSVNKKTVKPTIKTNEIIYNQEEVNNRKNTVSATGILKQVNSDELLVTVDGNDVIYRFTAKTTYGALGNGLRINDIKKEDLKVGQSVTVGYINNNELLRVVVN